MAVAFTAIGSATDAFGTNPKAITLSAGAAAGTLVTVFAACLASSGGPAVSCTDSKGNTYTLDKTVASDYSVAIFRTVVATPLVTSDTISVTYTGSPNRMCLQALCWTGLTTSSPLDKTASATGAGTSWNGGTTAATTQADEVVIAGFAATGAIDTPSGGYVSLFTPVNSGLATPTLLSGIYKVVAATGTQNPTTTGLSSVNWAGATVTYSAVPSVPDPATTDWVPVWDMNAAAAAISGTVIDAAGDLIVGSANDTAARLAAPTTNGDVLTADTSLANKVKWATPAGGGTGLPADTVVAAATRIIANLTTAGDTQNAWRILGSGRMDWGAGGTTAPDTNLYRAAADILQTDDVFRIVRAGAGATASAFEAYHSGDAYPRWTLREDGKLEWGPGTGATDTTLYRSAGNSLKTDGNLYAAGGLYGNSYVIAAIGTANEVVLGYNGSSDAPAITFTNARDTNLYRAAADRLKTDDHFDATAMGLATKVKAGAPVDGDWAAVPPVGTIVYDSTNSKLWVRHATATWKGVVVA